MRDEGMSIKEFREYVGFQDGMDWADYLKAVVMYDEDCYACCEEKCIVDKDGYCEHGYPSILIKMGII